MHDHFIYFSPQRHTFALIGGGYFCRRRSISRPDAESRLSAARYPPKPRLPVGNAWSLLAVHIVDNRVRPSRAFEKRAARTASRILLQHVRNGRRFNKNTNLAKNVRRGVPKKTGCW